MYGTGTFTLNDIIPLDELGVVLPFGGEVVLKITGRVPLIDDAATLHSPSFPSLAASLSVVRTHFSLTMEPNFRLRSTIKLSLLQDKHKGIEDQTTTSWLVSFSINLLHGYDPLWWHVSQFLTLLLKTLCYWLEKGKYFFAIQYWFYRTAVTKSEATYWTFISKDRGHPAMWSTGYHQQTVHIYFRGDYHYLW